MTKSITPRDSGVSGTQLLAAVTAVGVIAMVCAGVANAESHSSGSGLVSQSQPASATTKKTVTMKTDPMKTGTMKTGTMKTGTMKIDTTAASGSPSSSDSMMSETGQRRISFSFRTLDDPADPTFNQLLGINDYGRIVGYFGSGADAAHPNKGYQLRRSDYRNQFINENFPGSAQTQVVGINNEGTTVGFFVDQAGVNTGFVKYQGQFTPVSNPLTPVDAAFNQLLGINDHGIAVGFYNDAAGMAHGYTYDIRAHTFKPVQLPVDADAVTATGINNSGDVSGFYVVGKTTRAFLIDHGYFHQLSFGAGTNTQAFGVTKGDQVVGSYVDAAGAMHGFLWSNHHLTRIDDPNGAGGTLVNGLNTHDDLVGFYVDAAGLTHGFLARHNS